MLFQSSPFKFVLLLMLASIRINVIAHRCYSCEDESCDKFDPSNSTFIKNCPSAKGCSIQTYEGDVIRRSCENIQLQDCQTANNVRYCYCITNLCNGKIVNHLNINDDEDFAEEGSGSTVYKHDKTTPQPSSQSNAIQFNIFIVSVFLYCNVLI